MSPRRLSLVAAPIALVVVLTGCSDDSQPTVGSSPTSSRPAAAGPVAPGGVRTVAGSEALRLAAQGAVVLDVRTPEEYADGHLEGARNLNLADDFEGAVSALPRTGRYVVYCRSGNRSAQAAAVMMGLGFTAVADAGGLDNLAQAGGKVVR